MPEIATQFGDSVCVRCGLQFAKGDRVNWARPFGVWCIERCIPEFEEPEGDLAAAIEVLERLESEGRLKGYTRGMLERYRVFGRLSDAHIYSVLPQSSPELAEDSAHDQDDAEAEVEHEMVLRTGKRTCPGCGRRKLIHKLRRTRNQGGGWDSIYRCEACDYEDVAV